MVKYKLLEELVKICIEEDGLFREEQDGVFYCSLFRFDGYHDYCSYLGRRLTSFDEQAHYLIRFECKYRPECGENEARKRG